VLPVPASRLEQAGQPPMPEVDIRAKVLEVAGPQPSVSFKESSVIYTNPATGDHVIEYPAFGLGSVTRAASRNAPKESFRYSSSVLGFSGSPKKNLTAARAFARDYALRQHRNSVRIRGRTDMYEHTWSPMSLEAGIENFVGSPAQVVQDGYKVRIQVQGSSQFILDDPEGQYFRVFVVRDGRTIPLDSAGNEVLGTDSQSLARTHFSYKQFENELQRPTLEKISDLGTVANEEAGPRTPPRVLSKADADSAQALPQEPVGMAPGILEPALNDPDPRRRIELLDQLSWDGLSEPERSRLLEQIRKLTNSFEMAAYVRLAERSGDPRWRSTLSLWVENWREFQFGWQKHVRAAAEKALKSLPEEKPTAIPKPALRRTEAEDMKAGALLRVRDVVHVGNSSGGTRGHLWVFTEFPIKDLNTVNLSPGAELEVIEGPRKIEGSNVVRVRVSQGGRTIEGYSFWGEVRLSTDLLREGVTASKAEAPAKKPKFSKKYSETEYGPDKTYYGTPYAKAGEIVFTPYSNSMLTPKSVGKVTGLVLEEGTGKVRVEVLLLDGSTVLVSRNVVAPLSDDEIKQVYAFHEGKLKKAPWFSGHVK
jgi:hypothetical protein